jgi:hypothetical protein
MMGDPALKRDMPDNDNDEVRIRKKVRPSPKPLKVLREQTGVVCPGKGVTSYHINLKDLFFLTLSS